MDAEDRVIEVLNAIWAQGDPVRLEVQELALEGMRAQALGTPLPEDHAEKFRLAITRRQFIFDAEKAAIDEFSEGLKQGMQS